MNGFFGAVVRSGWLAGRGVGPGSRRRGVPGQHLHHRPARTLRRARRWSRTGTSSSSGPAPPGRRRRRGVRPAVRGIGGAAAAASSGSTPTPRGARAEPGVAVGSGGDFVVRLGERRRTVRDPSILGQRFDAAGSRDWRRVPGQHLHDRRPVRAGRRPGRRRPVRRELDRAGSSMATTPGSPPAGSTRPATPSAASSW